MESRIHGDMYVRFGGRYGETYRRKAARRPVPSLHRIAGLNYSKDKSGKQVPLVDENGEKLPQVSVKKGEKSFPVFLTTFTVVDKETKEKIKYDDFRKLSEEEQKRYSVYPKLNVFNVFNVDQTNMKEARPELYARIVADNELKRPVSIDEAKMSFPALDAMIEHGLWVCPIFPRHQDKAYYSITKDEIVVPEKSQFISGESFYGTLLHEMTHSTGAKERLDRFKASSFGDADYAREELVAELGSALISSRYGIAKQIKDESAAYLQSWLKELKESPDFIKTTLFDVKRASSMITQCIDGVQERLNEQVDLMDADNDGNTLEVAHVEREPFEVPTDEYVPFRRGR